MAAALVDRLATEGAGTLAALHASPARRRAVWLALVALVLVQLEWVAMNIGRLS